MTVLYNETCQLCDKRIKHDEPVIRMEVGRARKEGFLRDLLGLISSRYGRGLSFVHVDCVEDIDYSDENPHLSLIVVEDLLKNE